MALALNAFAPVALAADAALERPAERVNTPAPAPSLDVARDEEAELLDRLALGDQSAFRILVERHIDRMFALALRILGSRDDAEDVVQDTFLKVWSRRAEYQQGRAKFSTWLYRVVTNRCIDLRRRPRTEDVEAVPEPADLTPDAMSSLQRSEVAGMLDEAMNSLPEQQRIAVILSYHEEMSNADIADIMGTTVMAVESLLKRGRQQLKKALRRNEGDIRQTFTDA
jgi:RNA polymerase sigma-70 factor (ECF subfamily)